MKRILLGYPATGRHLDQIRAVCPGTEVVVEDPQHLGRALLDADIFCGHVKGPVDWDTIVDARRLRWIQSSAAGLDHCLCPAVIGSEITVSSASGVFADSVAEQTMALLLGVLRGLHQFIPAWNERVYTRLPTDDLAGKSIGLVGLGGNGSRIAEVLAPWSVRIQACDYYVAQANRHVEHVYPPHELQRLVQTSDIVIITLPLTPTTARLFGREQLSWIPHGGYLINVGRGKVVDEPALVEALKSGNLAGAGLDVTFDEPPAKESPLWSLKNVIVTPHVGAQSNRRLDRTTELFCLNLQRFQAGKRLFNVVDKRLGFPAPDDRWAP